MRHYFKIQPGDIPAYAAAKRMGLSETCFLVALPDLIARGFPKPDITTGLFDLTAIDEWRAARHRGETKTRALDARDVLQSRLPRLAGHG